MNPIESLKGGDAERVVEWSFNHPMMLEETYRWVASQRYLPPSTIVEEDSLRIRENGRVD